MDEFTKKQAHEITGLPLRSIQYYTERGVIVPEVDPGEGKGSKRLYSKKNLVEIGIIKCLSDYQLAFPVVKRVMGFLKFPIPYHESAESVHAAGINMGGIIGSWEEIEGPAYIVVFKRIDKGFLPTVHFGKDTARMLDSQWLDVSESVLIIDFGRIIKMVRGA